jgi:hypothetical protein
MQLQILLSIFIPVILFQQAHSLVNMTVDLSNPGRTLRAGVILMGESAQTEVLDVSPIDFFHGMTKRFMPSLPLPDDLKAKALDMDFYWITEKGKDANLTADIKLRATVGDHPHFLVQTVEKLHIDEPAAALLRRCTSSRHRPHRRLRHRSSPLSPDASRNGLQR